MAVYNSNLTSDLARLREVLNDDLPASFAFASDSSSSFTISGTPAVEVLSLTLNGVKNDECFLVLANALISASAEDSQVRFFLYVNGVGVHSLSFKSTGDLVVIPFIGVNHSGNIPISLRAERPGGGSTITLTRPSLWALRFKRRS